MYYKKRRSFYIIRPRHSGIAKRPNKKNKKILLPRLPVYEVASLMRRTYTKTGKASAVLIFVL